MKLPKKIILDQLLSIVGKRIFSDKSENFYKQHLHANFSFSDGCGRTGAYLCIDANLDFSQEDNLFDVFGYTKKMRQARKGMIETVVSKLLSTVAPFIFKVHID